MSNNFVKIELQITQHVLKEDIQNYDEFVEVFEDVEPYFIEDSFEHLNINSVSTNFKVGKCEEQDQHYCRKLDGEISFSVDSIKELKEFLEEEYVLDEGEFDGNRFVVYYILRIVVYFEMFYFKCSKGFRVAYSCMQHMLGRIRLARMPP